MFTWERASSNITRDRSVSSSSLPDSSSSEVWKMRFLSSSESWTSFSSGILRRRIVCQKCSSNSLMWIPEVSEDIRTGPSPDAAAPLGLLLRLFPSSLTGLSLRTVSTVAMILSTKVETPIASQSPSEVRLHKTCKNCPTTSDRSTTGSSATVSIYISNKASYNPCDINLAESIPLPSFCLRSLRRHPSFPCWQISPSFAPFQWMWGDSKQH